MEAEKLLASLKDDMKVYRWKSEEKDPGWLKRCTTVFRTVRLSFMHCTQFEPCSAELTFLSLQSGCHR